MHFWLIVILLVLILVAVSYRSREWTDTAARLGIVIYWVCCGAAVLWLVVFFDSEFHADDWFIMLAPAPLLWGFGYACRYVLAGNR
jgi:apolipoprotein N-acyltransferase